MQTFQYQGETFLIEPGGNVAIRQRNRDGSYRWQPVQFQRAAQIRQAFQQQQQQQKRLQEPTNLIPNNEREAARRKIKAANEEYTLELQKLQKNRAFMTQQQYDKRVQEIRQELKDVIGMIRETHGIGQRKQKQKLTSHEIDRALASTPIPGEPKKRQQFSNTAYHPQRNIYS